MNNFEIHKLKIGDYVKCLWLGHDDKSIYKIISHRLQYPAGIGTLGYGDDCFKIVNIDNEKETYSYHFSYLKKTKNTRDINKIVNFKFLNN